MTQTLINYPSDTNRLGFLATPASQLNASQAALNASIKNLTDAITAAQSLLATLVPYTGANQPVNLNGQDLTNIGTSGDSPALAVNSGAITSLDGGAITTDGSGNIYLAGNPGPWLAGTSGVGINLHAGNGYQMIVQGDVSSDVGFSIVDDANLVQGSMSFRATDMYFDSILGHTISFGTDQGGSSPASSLAINTNTGQSTFTDGTNTVNLCTGSTAIATVGPASLDSGAITTDGSGNLTGNSASFAGGDTLIDSSGNITVTGNIQGGTVHGSNLPFAPSSDGSYHLTCVVTGGIPSFSWT